MFSNLRCSKRSPRRISTGSFVGSDGGSIAVRTGGGVATLDTKTDAGCLVETAGFVRALDREAFQSAANPAWDQLWSFGLAETDAADAPLRVVVIHPAESKSFGLIQVTPGYHRPLPFPARPPLHISSP